MALMDYEKQQQVSVYLVMEASTRWGMGAGCAAVRLLLTTRCDSPQAEDLVSNSSEVVDEASWQSSRGEKDSELPAGVQEGEPRPLKRSRRCVLPPKLHFQPAPSGFWKGALQKELPLKAPFLASL